MDPASENSSYSRSEYFIQKLQNFLKWLLGKPYVNRSPKAVESIRIILGQITIVDEKTGAWLGYEIVRGYVKKWVEPGFEWKEDENKIYRWQIREGASPLSWEEWGKKYAVYFDGKNQSEFPTWKELVIHLGAKYLDIVADDEKEESEREKFFQYMNCFLDLSSAFNVKAEEPPATKKFKKEAE